MRVVLSDMVLSVPQPSDSTLGPAAWAGRSAARASPPDATSGVCLFLDVDGSLIDIAPRPEAVVVPTTLVADLEGASAALGGALALVSGRAIAQLDTLFRPLRLRASGVHGAEMRLSPEAAVSLRPGAAVPQPVRRDLVAVLHGFPGTFVEDKRFSLAVHYRAVPEIGEALLAALRALIGRHAEADLTVLPGHAVFELKRSGFDKGEAVRRFLADPPFRGRMPIFVGDDITDRPGFAAAIAAGGTAYGVGRDIAGTTGTFDSPAAVRDWVGKLAGREMAPA